MARSRAPTFAFAAVLFAYIFILSGCAGDLRQPAASLANAGVSATTALSTDHRSKAGAIRSLDAIEAFSRTYEYCASADVTCRARPSRASEERAGIAAAIGLRANAVEALGNAYKALEAEAAYDAKADVEGATSGAIAAINSYAAAIAAVPGTKAAPLIGQPIGRLIGYGAGLLAARAQNRRIVHDSRAIGAATLKLRDALDHEAYVFDDLVGYIGELQTAATLDMIESGLTPPDAGLKPLLDDLGLPPSKNAESLISASPRLKTALAAALTARSRARVADTQAAYRAAIGALNELLKAHADIEAKRPPSLAGLNARIAELNALLAPLKETHP